MRAIRVTFGFTKNLGNFQSARVDVTLEEDHSGDTFESMVETAQALVMDFLDMPIDERQRQILEVYREGDRQRASIFEERKG